LGDIVASKHRIGILQGRLSPRPSDKLQAFPHITWRSEFDSAARLGFDALEWIYEADRVEENPLKSESGRAGIRRAIQESGVPVRSVCADYFMVRRLAGGGQKAIRESRDALAALVDMASEVGAERILLPLLETAAVETPELKHEIVESLVAVAPIAERAKIVLGLEMELPGSEYAALIDRVGHPSVRAYYDAGNSTAQGFDVSKDIEPLLPMLHAIHVKDRKVHGKSVYLGDGDTNFDGLFRVAMRAGFAGDLVLQHYFDDDPEGAARAALGFVRERLRLAAGAA
jgi:hexulose-6-phosphate isomerase